MDPGEPLTDAESTKKALDFIGTNPKLWLADFRLYMDGNLNWIELAIPEHTHLFYDKKSLMEAMRIYRWQDHHSDIEHIRVVAEIYKTSRKAKPIFRIVRRGRSRRFPKKRYDLAEWYLRLTDGPMIITKYNHNDVMSFPPTKLEARMPKPIEILELARHSTRCAAALPGCEVHVNLMRWGNQFVKMKGGPYVNMS